MAILIFKWHTISFRNREISLHEMPMLFLTSGVVFNCDHRSVLPHFTKGQLSLTNINILHFKCPTLGIYHTRVIHHLNSYVVSWIGTTAIECSLFSQMATCFIEVATIVYSDKYDEADTEETASFQCSIPMRECKQPKLESKIAIHHIYRVDIIKHRKQTENITSLTWYGQQI